MNTYTELTDYWDLIDPDKIEDKLHPVAQLINWSLNYDSYSPFSLYLDLIGWSLETLGENMFDPMRHQMHFGYVEADYLGEALTCYAERPHEVFDYVTKVLEAELDA